MACCAFRTGLLIGNRPIANRPQDSILPHSKPKVYSVHLAPSCRQPVPEELMVLPLFHSFELAADVAIEQDRHPL
jgi:hypothetical protein